MYVTDGAAVLLMVQGKVLEDVDEDKIFADSSDWNPGAVAE